MLVKGVRSDYIPSVWPFINLPLANEWFLFTALILSVLLTRVSANMLHNKISHSIRIIFDILIFFLPPLLFLLFNLVFISLIGAASVYQIPVHGLCIFLGVSLAYLFLRSRLENFLSPSQLFYLFAGICIIALIGARFTYLILFPKEFADLSTNQWITELINLSGGGMVSYGAFIPLLLVSFFVIHNISQKYNSTAAQIWDLVIPPLLLALAIGRFGCFANGCCYGNECQTAWGVKYPATITMADLDKIFDAPPQESYIAWREKQMTGQYNAHIARHPAPLYEAIPLFIIALILLYLSSTKQSANSYPGLIACTGIISASLARLLSEAFRGDHTPVYAGLSLASWVMLLLLLIAVIWAIQILRQNMVESDTK